MSISMLFSAHPQPGRIFEAVNSLKEARPVIAPHTKIINQWRAEVAGPNTGTLYSVLS